MDKFIKRAIDEHKELSERIDKLVRFIDDVAIDDKNIGKYEYSLMVVQLEHMISYAKTLMDRLNHHGVYFNDDEYFEKVDAIKQPDNTHDNQN